MSSWADIRRYRATAARLRQMTLQMRFAESRVQTLRIAQQFERLADHVERRLGRTTPRSANIVPFRRAS